MILCNSRPRRETPEGRRRGGLGLRKRDRLAVTMPRFHYAFACFVALASAAARACDSGAVALFGCDAAQSRKFIELCAPSPLDAKSGYLVYRFGSLNEDGEEKSVEFEYPADSTGSLKRFYGATYTHAGVYTQSVRFVSGNFGYTVFTRSRGAQTIAAGVEVRDRKSGKKSIVACNERPRFYIFELQGVVACDPETPVGTACIK